MPRCVARLRRLLAHARVCRPLLAVRQQGCATLGSPALFPTHSLLHASPPSLPQIADEPRVSWVAEQLAGMSMADTPALAVRAGLWSAECSQSICMLGRAVVHCLTYAIVHKRCQCAALLFCPATLLPLLVPTSALVPPLRLTLQTPLKTGDKCLAQSAADKGWYRATVEKAYTADPASVWRGRRESRGVSERNSRSTAVQLGAGASPGLSAVPCVLPRRGSQATNAALLQAAHPLCNSRPPSYQPLSVFTGADRPQVRRPLHGLWQQGARHSSSGERECALHGARLHAVCCALAGAVGRVALRPACGPLASC